MLVTYNTAIPVIASRASSNSEVLTPLYSIAIVILLLFLIYIISEEFRG